MTKNIENEIALKGLKLEMTDNEIDHTKIKNVGTKSHIELESKNASQDLAIDGEITRATDAEQAIVDAQEIINDGKSDKYVSVVNVTTSKTFDLTDADTFQVCDHATIAIDLTIPPNATVEFPIGTCIAMSMSGVAQVAIVAGSGVTIQPSTTLKIYAINETIAIIKIATDTWIVSGSLKV